MLEFRAAGIASRLIAITLDVFLQFVLLVGVIVVIGLLAVVNATVAVVAALVLIFLVFWGYPALMETFWAGRTVGKRLLRIRVLTVEGGPIGFRHAAIRALLGLIDFWLPVPGGLFALVAALVTRRSQRLGDLAAGTIVVREPKGVEDAVFFNAITPPVAPGASGPPLDPGLLRPHHYALAREFLIRAPDLLPRSRHDLGVDLAERLAAATGNRRPPEMPPELFLQSLLFAYQERSRSVSTGAPPPPNETSIAAPPPTGAPVAGAPPAGLAAPASAPAAVPAPSVSAAGAPSATSTGRAEVADLPMPTGPPLVAPPPDAERRIDGSDQR